MNPDTKRQIENFAWDCTVGQGNDGDMDQDVVNALGVLLGHAPTNDELLTLQRAWNRCQQEMAQP